MTTEEVKNFVLNVYPEAEPYYWEGFGFCISTRNTVRYISSYWAATEAEAWDDMYEIINKNLIRKLEL